MTPAAPAAWLHGVAAQLAVERHGPPLAALDLLDALPGAWDVARSAAAVKGGSWQASRR